MCDGRTDGRTDGRKILWLLSVPLSRNTIMQSCHHEDALLALWNLYNDVRTHLKSTPCRLPSSPHLFWQMKLRRLFSPWFLNMTSFPSRKSIRNLGRPNPPLGSLANVQSFAQKGEFGSIFCPLSHLHLSSLTSRVLQPWEWNQFLMNTAEAAYSRLQGNKEYCLLKEKFTITGIEKWRNKGKGS